MESIFLIIKTEKSKKKTKNNPKAVATDVVKGLKGKVT